MSKGLFLKSALALVLAIIAVVAYRRVPVAAPPATAESALPATDCAPGLSACVATLPDGGQLELSITPTPIRPLHPLTLRVTLSGPAAKHTGKVEVDFAGTHMDMGYYRPELSGSDGRFSAEAMLPVCVTGPMNWTATVLLSGKRQRLAVHFRFAVAGR